jgi:hypothetical protein
VKDSGGQSLAYVYFEDEGRRATLNASIRDEARRIGSEYREAAGAIFNGPGRRGHHGIC